MIDLSELMNEIQGWDWWGMSVALALVSGVMVLGLLLHGALFYLLRRAVSEESMSVSGLIFRHLLCAEQAIALQALFEHAQQFRNIAWLGHEIAGSPLDGLDRSFDAAVGRSS